MMDDIFNNSWVIGINSSIIAGLILYYIFGIGKPSNKAVAGTAANTLKSSRVSLLIAGILFGIISSYIFDNYIFKLVKQTQENVPVVTQTKNPLLSSFSPQDIANNIINLPPYQQETARQNYKGIPVKWSVNLFSTTPSSEGERIYSIPTGQTSLMSLDVVFTIDIKQYPQLKIMQSGQEFIVEGTIDSVSPLNIELVNCHLYFN